MAVRAASLLPSAFLILNFLRPSLEPIQSARAEYDFRAAFSEHDRSPLAYSAARASDDDDLVFDFRHEVFLSTFYFHIS
jgi:hypothetical protein